MAQISGKKADNQHPVRGASVSMNGSYLASENPWTTLSLSEAPDQESKGAKKKGAVRSANVNGGAPASNVMKDGSDAIASFKAARGISNASGPNVAKENKQSDESLAAAAAPEQSWTNISAQQRTRKKESGQGQRHITVADAIAELEAKSLETHTTKVAKRSATWAQWCRRMEDSRVDADTQYVDEENENALVTFTEVFLRSNVLEEVVKSSLRNAISDETELQYLFSLTLYGDSLLHDRLAKGLKNVGDFFHKTSQQAPSEFLDQMALIVCALKLSPASRTKRVETMSLQKLEEQISMNVSKLNALSRPDLPNGTEAKCKTTLDLVTLVDQKQAILTRGLQGLSKVDPAHLVSLAEDLLHIMKSMRDPLLQSKNFAEQQYTVFQNKLKTALAGDDSEYLRVFEVERAYDLEIQGLRNKEDELRRQLEQVAQEISSVQQRQKQHKAQSAKVLSVYNERMKAFQGEDSKVLGTLQAAEKNLHLCQSCCDFMEEIRDKAVPVLKDEAENCLHALQVARRQALAYLTLYLEASKENSDLINRRQKFCNDKVDAMRREQREALDLGLSDLAADLGASICKLEQQHERVIRQVKAEDVKFELVHRIYISCRDSATAAKQGAGSNGSGYSDQHDADETQLQDIRNLLIDLGHPI